MKPRLQAAPLTDEDLAIMLGGYRDIPVAAGRLRPSALLMGTLFGLSLLCDRRDAGLMLAWAQGWPIDLGGNDEEGECLFWGDPP